MYIDPTVTAANVSDWTALGIKLPADLTKLIDAYEALRYVEVGHQPVIDVTKLKASNAAAEVDKIAGELSLNEQREEAKRRLLATLANKIVREAGDAVPDLVEQLTPGFETEAAKFAEAVAKLPQELSPETIVASADPSVLTAFGDAKQAASHLAAVDAWVAGLSQLPQFAGVESQPVLRVLAPDTHSRLHTLLTARNGVNHDELVRQINPVFLKAARLGISFEIHTPREADQLRQRLEASKPLTAGQRLIGMNSRR